MFIYSDFHSIFTVFVMPNKPNEQEQDKISQPTYSLASIYANLVLILKFAQNLK